MSESVTVAPQGEHAPTLVQETAHAALDGLERRRTGRDLEVPSVVEPGRAEAISITDDEALAAFHGLTRTEGIIPALETAHAIAHVQKLAPTLSRDQIIVINRSGRGDKDVEQVASIREGS